MTEGIAASGIRTAAITVKIVKIGKTVRTAKIASRGKRRIATAIITITTIVIIKTKTASAGIAAAETVEI